MIAMIQLSILLHTSLSCQFNDYDAVLAAVEERKLRHGRKKPLKPSLQLLKHIGIAEA